MFNKCANLHTVMLPEGVEIIGREAFGECTALKHINFPVSVRLIDEGAFNKTALEEITLLNIRTIGMGAFMYCNQLKFITLPYTIENIASSAFTTSGNASIEMGRRYVHILGCGNDQEKQDKVYAAFGISGLGPNFFDNELARQHYELEDKVDQLESKLDTTTIDHKSSIEKLNKINNSLAKAAFKIRNKTLTRNKSLDMDMLD